MFNVVLGHYATWTNKPKFIPTLNYVNGPIIYELAGIRTSPFGHEEKGLLVKLF